MAIKKNIDIEVEEPIIKKTVRTDPPDAADSGMSDDANITVSEPVVRPASESKNVIQDVADAPQREAAKYGFKLQSTNRMGTVHSMNADGSKGEELNRADFDNDLDFDKYVEGLKSRGELYDPALSEAKMARSSLAKRFSKK